MDDPVARLMAAVSTRAFDAELIYDGEKPDRPRVVYSLSGRSRKRSYVYIFLRDDRVIYVGMSVNPGARFEKHGPKDWFPVANRYALIEFTGGTHHEARVVAMYVERGAIRSLAPSHNIVGVS